MVRNEGEIFFVLLQNVAPVAGRLLSMKYMYMDIYLMVFSFCVRSSSVCAVCAIFILHADNPILPVNPEVMGGDLQ